MSKTRDLANLADLNFDSGTMVVDKVNDRVGIGTSSPDAKLSLPAQASGDGVARIAIESAVDNNDFTIAQYEDGVGTYTQIGQNVTLNSGGNTVVLDSGHRTASIVFDGRGNGSLMFQTGGTNVSSEAMRIDSSGNLLVGGTTTNHQSSSSPEQLSYISGGYFAVSRSSGDVAIFNRQTTDGDIAVFRKDGTTVGSVKSQNGTDISIGSANTELRFFDSGDQIFPTTDNLTTLGRFDSRFKDLYLSGGVYLGGTGSANHLDDYEEGTFTPTIREVSRATSVTYDSWTGASYTKVGNLVVITMEIGISGHDGTTSNSSWRFDGFPFAANSDRGTLTVYNNNAGALIGGGRLNGTPYNALAYMAVPTVCALYVTVSYQTNS